MLDTSVSEEEDEGKSERVGRCVSLQQLYRPRQRRINVCRWLWEIRLNWIIIQRIRSEYNPKQYNTSASMVRLHVGSGDEQFRLLDVVSSRLDQRWPEQQLLGLYWIGKRVWIALRQRKERYSMSQSNPIPSNPLQSNTTRYLLVVEHDDGEFVVVVQLLQTQRHCPHSLRHFDLFELEWIGIDWGEQGRQTQTSWKGSPTMDPDRSNRKIKLRAKKPADESDRNTLSKRIGLD